MVNASEVGADGGRPVVLIVQNSAHSGPGNLTEWLAGQVRTVVVSGDDVPAVADGYDGVILLGGGLLPDDDERAPWLDAERRLTADALDRGVPLLGICLGAQLLAVVSGGIVRGSHGMPERGVSHVHRRVEAAADPLFSGLPFTMTVLQNHKDQIVELPPRAVHLAESAACGVQAFRIGRCGWGVQFHPEAPVSRLDSWDAGALEDEGFDLQRLRAIAGVSEVELERASRRLVENFVGVVRATARLRSIRVIDGHNDLMWEMRKRGAAPADFISGLPELHTDLARLRAGSVGAQFWSVWVPDDTPHPFRVVQEQIERVHALVAHAPEHLVLARTAHDVRTAFREGRIGCLIGAEGAHCLEGDLENLAPLAERGLRYLTLTHGASTAWADSATGERLHGGLSLRGADLVRELEALGILVDLSHVSHETMADVLDLVSKPVIFSHSSSYALTAHPRNVPDHILERLRDNGGVQMITFVPQFVSDADRRRHLENNGAPLSSPQATLADIADHVEHACDVAGIAHIGLGGDLDGISATPRGFADAGAYPTLLGELVRRGWSAAELNALASENVLRVLAATDQHSPVDGLLV